MIEKRVFHCEGRGCDKTSHAGAPDAERWIAIRTSVAITWGPQSMQPKKVHACSPACAATAMRAWADRLARDPRTPGEIAADSADARFVALQADLAQTKRQLQEEEAKRATLESNEAAVRESLRRSVQTSYLEIDALRDRLEVALRKHDELRAQRGHERRD